MKLCDSRCPCGPMSLLNQLTSLWYIPVKYTITPDPGDEKRNWQVNQNASKDRSHFFSTHKTDSVVSTSVMNHINYFSQNQVAQRPKSEGIVKMKSFQVLDMSSARPQVTMSKKYYMTLDYLHALSRIPASPSPPAPPP
jgi:hypothetical protein